MDPELTKWLSGLGVGGILAGFMFAVYRKDMKEMTEHWKGQTELLVQVVKENTAAFSQNTAVIQSLHTHMRAGERRTEER